MSTEAPGRMSQAVFDDVVDGAGGGLDRKAFADLCAEARRARDAESKSASLEEDLNITVRALSNLEDRVAALERERDEWKARATIDEAQCEQMTVDATELAARCSVLEKERDEARRQRDDRITQLTDAAGQCDALRAADTLKHDIVVELCDERDALRAQLDEALAKPTSYASGYDAGHRRASEVLGAKLQEARAERDTLVNGPALVAALEQKNTALRAKVERLTGALERIEHGCSFPSNDVERAIRDVARAALKDEARDEPGEGRKPMPADRPCARKGDEDCDHEPCCFDEPGEGKETP